MTPPLWTILLGDAREQLATLPAQSVHCCVTSPPYWALRDYGVDGQIGLEEDFANYVDALLEVFREVHRVLRDDGTLWMNLGDTYAGSGNGGGGSFMEERGDGSWKTKSTINGWKAPPDGFKPKDLLGIPWRIAFALQADGWTLRSDIIWHKPNPMPEAVADRPTKSHEYLFLLSKQRRYYYDADAIREPVTGGAHTRGGRVGGKCVPPGKGPQARVRQNESFGHSVRELVTSRNKRTVWTIATQAYDGDHYATYPEKLVIPCVLAGTSAAGCCSNCGAPLERQVEIDGPTFQELTRGREASGYAAASVGAPHSFAVRGTHGHVSRVRTTTGWATACECAADVVPCTVLDPFTGSGTTGAVAVTHGRRFLGTELNPEYVQQAESRIAAAVESSGRATASAPGPAGPVQLGLLAGLP